MRDKHPQTPARLEPVGQSALSTLSSSFWNPAVDRARYIFRSCGSTTALSVIGASAELGRLNRRDEWLEQVVGSSIQFRQGWASPHL